MNKTDFTAIRAHIHSAQISRAAYLADVISDGIVWILDAIRSSVAVLAAAGRKSLQPPEFYSTSLTRRPPA